MSAATGGSAPSDHADDAGGAPPDTGGGEDRHRGSERVSEDSGGTGSLKSVLLVLVVVLIVVALIQGATVQRIGMGPFSVDFGSPGSSASPAPQPGATPSAALPAAPSAPLPAAPPRQAPAPNVPPDASITGNWTATRVSLTVAVTQVEQQDGLLRLHVTATNNSPAELSLPLFGYCSASDDAGTTYQPSLDNSDWPDTVPSRQAVTGVIELEKPRAAGARYLSLSFSTVFGQHAPSGGITVKGIGLP